MQIHSAPFGHCYSDSTAAATAATAAEDCSVDITRRQRPLCPGAESFCFITSGSEPAASSLPCPAPGGYRWTRHTAVWSWVIGCAAECNQSAANRRINCVSPRRLRADAPCDILAHTHSILIEQAAGAARKPSHVGQDQHQYNTACTLLIIRFDDNCLICDRWTKRCTLSAE